MSTNNPAVVWPTQFDCSLIRNEHIYPNQYHITVSMFPNGEDGEEFTYGFKKLKYFISNFLDNAILIKTNHPLLENLSTIKTNTIQLPNDTHDLILATVLYHKFSAISQNQIIITEITIDSKVGDHIKYTVNTDNKKLEGDYWWNQKGFETNDSDVFPEWDDIKIQNNRFEPKVVLGGKNENRSIR